MRIVKHQPGETVSSTVIVERIRPRLLDLQSASAYCGLSETRIREYVRSGKLKAIALPHPFKGGKDTRKILIALEELDEFISKYVH